MQLVMDMKNGKFNGSVKMCLKYLFAVMLRVRNVQHLNYYYYVIKFEWR